MPQWWLQDRGISSRSEFFQSNRRYKWHLFPVNSLKFFTRRGGDRRPQSSCNRPVDFYCYDICTRHIFLNGIKLNNSIEKYAGDMRFSPDLHATVLQDSGSLTLICDGSLRQTWPKKLEKMTLQGGASGLCRAFLTILQTKFGLFPHSPTFQVPKCTWYASNPCTIHCTKNAKYDNIIQFPHCSSYPANRSAEVREYTVQEQSTQVSQYRGQDDVTYSFK